MKHLKLAVIAAFTVAFATAFSQSTVDPGKVTGGKSPVNPNLIEIPNQTKPSHAPATNSTKVTSPAAPTTKTGANSGAKSNSTPAITSTKSTDSTPIADTGDNTEINWPVTIGGVALIGVLGWWMWGRKAPAPAPRQPSKGEALQSSSAATAANSGRPTSAPYNPPTPPTPPTPPATNSSTSDDPTQLITPPTPPSA